MLIEKLIKLAKGKEKIDLVIKGGKIFNVFTGELEEGDLAISEGKIIGIGNYEGIVEKNIGGATIIPGFIDGHMHIESSLMSPKVLAKEFIKLGTTTVIADPHEIANVLGEKGIDYMLNETKDTILEVFFMFPSCVPATTFESSGATLNSESLKKYIDNPRILGLGEVMNFIGVENGDKDLIEKIRITQNKNKQVDGHSPCLRGNTLTSYIIAGVRSDHECSSIEEMHEKISKGMNILIREGTAAKNLEKLAKGINDYTYRFCMFCTDDRDAETVLNKGQINDVVKKAISLGISPEKAIIMATLNTAKFYGLNKKGAIAPGYDADFLVVDTIRSLDIKEVYKYGQKIEFNNIKITHSVQLKNSVNIGEFQEKNLIIPIKGDTINVISIIPKELYTNHVVRKIDNPNGYFQGKLNKNLSQISVVERHKATGNVGNGVIENYGIENGAIATTVAHDSHNIIVIGDNTKDMYLAIKELERIGGGIVLVKDGNIIHRMELTIAGLMSDKEIGEIYESNEMILKLAKEELKINKEIEPIMTLNFMALPVIPELKITDLGLFLVKENKFIEIEV